LETDRVLGVSPSYIYFPISLRRVLQQKEGGKVNQDCIFCRIIAGEIESDILYQDDEVFAIRDIRPQAPTHLLIITKIHIPSLVEVNAEQKGLLGHMIHVANELAREQGVAESGYRLVVNTGPHSGQLVAHLHLHLLGGRILGRLG